jgi:hypothetical protein
VRRRRAGPAGTCIEALEPAGHPVRRQAYGTRVGVDQRGETAAGEALMTRTAVSVRLSAGAPVALVDHARAERPGLDQIQRDVFGDRRQEPRAATDDDRIAEEAQLVDEWLGLVDVTGLEVEALYVDLERTPLDDETRGRVRDSPRAS